MSSHITIFLADIIKIQHAMEICSISLAYVLVLFVLIYSLSSSMKYLL